MRTLESLGELAGKTVIVRSDLNVPLKDGVIIDDGRIRAAAVTVSELRDKGARVVVCSHLGRPGGEVKPEFSLRPVATRFGEILGSPVSFVSESVGEAADQAIQALNNGEVLLLENLRFNPQETSKDETERQAFAAELSKHTDFVVLDGFGVVHRSQASVTELAKARPSAAGRLVAAEVDVLEKLTVDAEKPYVVVLGGSKVSDKLGVIDHLLERVDKLVIGGGMLFTFLAAQGHSVASSLLESDQIPNCQKYLERAKELGVELLLPVDVVVAEKFAPDAAHETVAADKIAESRFGEAGIGLDIGPESAKKFAETISSAKTVFWNGPMGVFEMPAFAHGTREVAEALTRVSGLSVVGGGDSAAAVRQLGFKDDQFGHISTGGGASLEFLEGKTLPGLEVLR